MGNARTFLINWILARRNGWRIVLRIEDIDSPRIKPGAAEQAMQDLRWLGLDWDQGPIYQTRRLPLYRAAIEKLLKEKRAYPCVCTRKEVETAASAPHASDGATIYPGTCRDRFSSIAEACAASGRDPALRFDTRGSGIIEFLDDFHGPRAFNVERDLGDFVIAKSDGTPAYQLAVVIDDADMAVTRIVRGDDLLDSTPRQILLYRALGLSKKIPHYCHLPLIVGPDGRRLAKRHGDTRLSAYRAAGVSPQRLLALLARWSGLDPGDSITSEQFIASFNLTRLPPQPIIMTPNDDAWLRGAGPSSAR